MRSPCDLPTSRRWATTFGSWRARFGPMRVRGVPEADSKPGHNGCMFTGIVTGLGRILEARPFNNAGHDDGKRLTIEAPPDYLDDTQAGDSIALDGACMTVTSIDLERQRFTVDVSAESLRRTATLHQPG